MMVAPVLAAPKMLLLLWLLLYLRPILYVLAVRWCEDTCHRQAVRVQMLLMTWLLSLLYRPSVVCSFCHSLRCVG